MLFGIPIRSFHDAKRRLRLPDRESDLLARHLAATTVTAASESGTVVIASSDPQVRRWGNDRGIAVIDDGGSLNAAADAIVGFARGRPWAVLHADLPLVTSAVLDQAEARLGDAPALLSPSWDGGTSLIMGHAPQFRFTYGPASFTSHLGNEPSSQIFVDRRLALDVDEPEHWSWMQHSNLAT